ncbi:MAG TPA: hypothetical protein VF192_09765 [Longimicrobiales bacterium]
MPRNLLHIPIVTAVALLAAVGEAASQDFRTAIGYGGGAVAITPLNAGGQGSEELRFEPGWIIAAHIEHRFGNGWLGLRAQGAYTQRPLAIADSTLAINVWFADAEFVLRPFGAGSARGVSPFVSLGAGLIKYGFGRGRPVEIVQANARYDGASEHRWAAVLGLGLDMGPVLEIQETPLGLRLEVGDHIALDSPFEPISGPRFSPVHNMRATLSVVSLVGGVGGAP